MSGRFVIFADMHLGLIGGQPDGQHYGDIAPVIERAARLVVREQPDRIILLGDTVNRGYDREYDDAKRLLAPLGDKLVPIVGNHELQRASVADFERNMAVAAYRTERICEIPSIILNSGIENLPDSEWQGELSPAQLRFLDEQLPRVPAGPLFVFVHHPIPGTVRNSEKPMYGLTNGQELLRRLERRGGPIVVFSAHTHDQSFARAGSIASVGCPALGFWPHAFVIVDVDDAALAFRTVRVIDDPDASPDANARDAAYRAAREGSSADQSGTVSLAAR
jgi:3',5'-cyclic AMP phosphodiesterase CpdA